MFLKGIHLNHLGWMGKDVDGRKESIVFYSLPPYSVMRCQGCDLQWSQFSWLGLCQVTYCSKNSTTVNLLPHIPRVVLSSLFIFHMQGFKVGNINWFPYLYAVQGLPALRNSQLLVRSIVKCSLCYGSLNTFK